jgi:hypothetical protein
LLRDLKAARLAEAEALDSLIEAVTHAAAPSTSLPPSSTSLEEPCYLSVRQLAARIPYAEKTIRNLMTTRELAEGVHFFKCRGRIMFLWSAMRAWVEGQAAGAHALPLVRNRDGRP